MPTIKQVAVTESATLKKPYASYQGKRLLSTLVSTMILSVVSLSASAATLINNLEYLDYELPKTIQERCIERDNCPNVEVNYLKTNHDWINKITNARINNLVINSKPSESSPITKIADAKVIKSAIDNFVTAQFADLPDDRSFSYELMVKPDYIGHVNSFEMFKIDAYIFTGGAHGMPYSEYLIFDMNTKKQVRLEDMLQAGKKPRFKALAYDVYKTWVKTVDKDVVNYEKSWPFTLSENITLTDKGVDIQYQHYDIAPYAYGMPVLSIPYSKLRGIIKPSFLPK
ncbi:RsiV family protein [Psychrobacter sp. GP33]|uniref:RsiV family protein n=1 Tax=Psychrobacter sp. GP33 TaxID=2758709 RepID=UPI0015F90A9A|nr:RsiV family protein [Psychrobacter sp. GP33]